MRRKALLMGMAVMTSLPGGVLAKGTGKGDRLSHPYAGALGGYTLDLGQEATAYGLSGPAGSASTGIRAAALLARVKTLLRGQPYAGGEQPMAVKGWSVELTNPGGQTDAATGLRQDKGLNLGLAFRFTF